MAIPVVEVVTDPSTADRTKFAQNGLSFAKLVAQWPTVLPPDPPDTMDDMTATDRYEQGDNAKVTRILFRIIENRATANTDVLPDAIRDLILGDSVLRTGAWVQQGTTTFWYYDVVQPVRSAERLAGRASFDMPGVTVNALTRCYWVTAWLGLTDVDFLLGYDNTP